MLDPSLDQGIYEMLLGYLIILESMEAFKDDWGQAKRILEAAQKPALANDRMISASVR